MSRTLRTTLVAVLLALATALTAGAAAKEKGDKAKKAGEEKEEEKDKPKPFAEVVKGAARIDGLFELYRREEKVWLAIGPEQFDQIYFLALSFESGIGEGWFYAAQMGGMAPVELHKEGKSVQLVAKNLRFLAAEGTPIERAIERSFSDSVVAQAEITSQPHPETKRVLVELGKFFLTDLPDLSGALEETFRIPYAFDSDRSTFGRLQAFERNVEIDTRAIYAVPKLPVPPLLPPGAPAPPMPPPPRNLPDPRAMTFALRWSLLAPPEPGFAPRAADDRVGHFFEDREDFTTDVADAPTVRWINRWRLERADPEAALSKPKKPIVFWLENTIPAEYRDAVREGILAWNAAFEKIGFQDAIEVQQQPDDADWSAADPRFASVRWFATTDAVFAIGPSIADPRTGEILDADIGFTESITRFARLDWREEVGPASRPANPLRLSPWLRVSRGRACELGEGILEQASFGLDVMVARGMDPDGPEAAEYMRQLLAHITAHEVGHTLGLRHNYIASTIHPLDRLHDRALTGSRGIVGSVMEYAPVNLSEDAARQGEWFQIMPGPYDEWAIEYAYKPIDAASPEAERAELRRIAARSTEPLLAYGTDEDAGFGGAWDMDPLAVRWDLGADPLAFAAQRARLSREIWSNIEAELEKPGEDYEAVRRSFGGALWQIGLSARIAARYIGGVHHPRAHAGDPGASTPFQPVPRKRQEEALAFLREHVFSAGAFEFEPSLLRKLAPRRFPNWRNFDSMLRRSDFPLHDRVLAIQRSALDRLFEPTVLIRVVDSEMLSDDALPLSTVFESLSTAIWEELGGAREIHSFRRNLQRDHLGRLIAMVLSSDAVPEDARTQARASLEDLRSRLTAAGSRGGVDAATRAHVRESLARVEETLKASAQRTAF